MGNNGARIAPNSIEAEEAVLGSVLINPTIMPMLTEFLHPSDFFEVKHSEVFAAMIRLYEARMEIDNLTLADELKKRRNKDGDTFLDLFGGHAFLTYLINSTPTFIYAESYARIVEVASMRRRLMEAAGNIASIAREENADLTTIVQKAESILFGVTSRQSKQGMSSMNEIINPLYQKIKTMYTNPGMTIGIPTGLSEIDNLLGGLQKSDLVILAARPGMGKTSLALSVALSMAKSDVSVGIFSLEMSKEQLGQRLYSMDAEVDLKSIRIGGMKAPEYERIMNSTASLEDLPMFVDDTAGLSISQLRSKARRLYREHGIDALIIDYLQLVHSDNPNDNEYTQVSRVSQAMKELARELNVPVLLLSQLSRNLENRTDKRPQLSDLRGSGSIEQDADAVIFLYRDSAYNENSTEPHKAEAIVAKQRNGPTGTAILYWDARLTRYMNASRTNVDLSTY